VAVLYFLLFFVWKKGSGKYVIATYQWRLVDIGYVPDTFDMRSVLGDVRCVSNVFLAYLFSNKEVGIQF
jgi:hypothetical protein